MSLLIDWYQNVHVTKYWFMSGGHYMHYLWKNGLLLCSNIQ